MFRTLLLRLVVAGALFTLVLSSTGCNTQPSDVLGFAYVAPETLNLRRELNQKSNAVAVMRHGDRVQILEVRRRFMRIRTDKGAEGWIDSAQLLTPEQMEQIKRDTQHALALPSEGSATVFEALNIHIEPSRQSPAFARISEGGSVEVLANKLEPKVTGPLKPPVFNFDRPQMSPHQGRKKREAAKDAYQLPPKPPPPKPPENWEALSHRRVDSNAPEPTAVMKLQEPKKPEVMEAWSLVRTKDKQCGWVLSRNLIMSIPDEVAQYAEGKRITSYFDLGAVTDQEKGVKHNWLWTTLSEPQPFDFDGWRVFLWNRRRHRYETSYREREVEGYFPVHLDPPEENAFDRTFQLITKDDDQKFWRRSYIFDGVRVHLTGKQEYHPNEAAVTQTASAAQTNKASQPGWFRQKWQKIQRIIRGRD